MTSEPDIKPSGACVTQSRGNNTEVECSVKELGGLTTAIIAFWGIHLTGLDVGSVEVAESERISYVLRLSNRGLAMATNVTVTDTLPSGVQVGDVSEPDIKPSGACVTQSRGNNTEVECSVKELGGLTTAIIAFSIATKDRFNAGDFVENQASCSWDGNLLPGCEAAAVTLIKPVEADLSMTKASRLSDDQLIYTLTVTNDGPSLATDLEVRDTLPVEVTFSSASPECNGENNAVTCQLGDLEHGSNKVVEIIVDVDPLATGDIINSASCSSAVADPNDCVATLSTNIDKADLSITKRLDPSSTEDVLVYLLEVNNSGPSDAETVHVTDTLPEGLTLMSFSGDCAEDANGVIDCNLGTLAVDDPRQLSITVSVDPGATRTVTNEAKVSSSTPEANPGNETDSTPTEVNPSADLVLTKWDLADPVSAGTNLTYRVSVENKGPSDAEDVVVTDRLPEQVTLVSANGCTENPSGSLDCPLGTIDADSLRLLSITVSVDPSATGQVTNWASVSSSTQEANRGNESAFETTVVAALAATPTATPPPPFTPTPTPAPTSTALSTATPTATPPAPFTATPTPTPTSTATNTPVTPSLAAKIVFVTSERILGRITEGSLTGVTAADAICNRLANAAPGTFKAWLSDTISEPASRFTQAAGPYKLVTGVTVADNWPDLIDGQLQVPIDTDEVGMKVLSVFPQVWTNTKADGTRRFTHCSDWTVELGPLVGGLGLSNSSDATWTDLQVVQCNFPSHIYCFEQ